MERRARRRKRFSRAGGVPPAEPSGPEVGAPDLWTFSAQPGLGSIDLLGWAVEATDGPVGHVEQATYDWRRSCLVVRTPPRERTLLPAGLVERLDRDSHTVFVATSREAIERAPDYDERLGAPDDAQRIALSRYYARIAST